MNPDTSRSRCFDAAQLRCLLDDLVDGTSVVELTADGPQRRDPTEGVTQHE